MLLSIVFGRFCNTQAGGLQPERQQYLRRNVKDPVQRIGRGLHSGRYRQVAQSYAYITAKKEYQSRRKKPVLTGAPAGIMGKLKRLPESRHQNGSQNIYRQL